MADSYVLKRPFRGECLTWSRATTADVTSMQGRSHQLRGALVVAATQASRAAAHSTHQRQLSPSWVKSQTEQLLSNA